LNHKRFHLTFENKFDTTFGDTKYRAGYCDHLRCYWVCGKQLRIRTHWQEESPIDLRKINESVLPVERNRLIVFGVYDNCSRRNLLAGLQCTMQRIHEQQLSRIG
jgi:hypothetical protein